MHLAPMCPSRWHPSALNCSASLRESERAHLGQAPGVGVGGGEAAERGRGGELGGGKLVAAHEDLIPAPLVRQALHWAGHCLQHLRARSGSGMPCGSPPTLIACPSLCYHCLPVSEETTFPKSEDLILPALTAATEDCGRSGQWQGTKSFDVSRYEPRLQG